ncbi:tripartite tricarboxylate transporter TctB family protein [Paracoccus xiamenensis]|uniref:tripartite tricarboxylate transporter TctB family protein n=1 Tax=Paracoccus xiamenensis TaxID=2714901 RepID=UPI00140B1972|nr:tripartite tricarboxylate transporter TctB family protein [Paracoccus xiamenensis]NHF74427.1 tripartite tricarboxylate transporter TctB family protein [Paracoccus xiamenensis]
MSDRIFGGIGLALAVLFAFQATLIEAPFISDAVGPSVFPIIIAMIMGLSSLYFLFKPDPEPAWPQFGQLAEIGLAAAVMFAYAQLLPVLGFVIATMFAAGYLAWRLGSKPIEAALVGIGTAVGIYAVFHLVLGLSLARGPLGF